ncbi:MAG: hypothetical protein ACJAZW_002926 [Maritalea sp.]|jgi:hypothetical protein
MMQVVCQFYPTSENAVLIKGYRFGAEVGGTVFPFCVHKICAQCLIFVHSTERAKMMPGICTGQVKRNALSKVFVKS